MARMPRNWQRMRSSICNDGDVLRLLAFFFTPALSR
jgi:hypothetical protein